jgi:hypothetical protein
MLDLTYILATVAFFALAALFGRGLERIAAEEADPQPAIEEKQR